MRKRLRKKKRVREFQEFGTEVSAILNAGVDFDAFLDDFIRDAIEANGLAFGGGGIAPRLDGFVELGNRDAYAESLSRLAAWLEADPRVHSFQLGQPVDLYRIA